MELRQYWRIVWDRRWVVLGVTLIALVAAIVSVAALPQPLPSYQATVQLGVRPTAFPRQSYEQFSEYYLFLASEFLNDDVINVVEGNGFLDALRQDEVVAADLGSGLELAVDPTVALLDPAGIPWQIEVDHHRRRLEIQALAEHVGGHEERDALGERGLD